MYLLTNEYKSAVKMAHTESERDRLIELGFTLIDDKPVEIKQGGKLSAKNKNRAK